MRLSPAPTPPLGTGSFLPRSSVSPELKLTLELSHWHRSALLYTHGRRLHKGRKTCSAVGRDTQTVQGTNLQTSNASAAWLLQEGQSLHPDTKDMKLTINITIFPLLTSCPWEWEASKWKHRLPLQYLFKTSYPEHLTQTTSFTAYLLCKLSCCHLFSLNFRFR